MTDFVDPLEEPLRYDMDPSRARALAEEEEANDELLKREHAAEDQREAEEEGLA